MMNNFHHNFEFSNYNRLLNLESVQPCSVPIPQRRQNFKSGSLYDRKALFKLKENLEKNREHIRDSGLLESLLTSINSRLINSQRNPITTNDIFREDEFDKNYNYYKSKINPNCDFETPVKKKVINKRLSSTPTAKRLNGDNGLDVSLGFSDINPIENTPKKQYKCKSPIQRDLISTEQIPHEQDCNEVSLTDDISKHVTFKSTPDQLSSMADISELTECLITSLSWQNEIAPPSTDVCNEDVTIDLDSMNILKEQLRVEKSANEEMKEKLEWLQTCWVRRELQIAEEKMQMKNVQSEIEEMKAAVMEHFSDSTIEKEEVTFSSSIKLLLSDLTSCRAENGEMRGVIKRQTEQIEHLNKSLQSLEQHQRVCDGVSKVNDDNVEDLTTRNEMLVQRVIDLEDSIKLLQDKFSFGESYLPRLKIRSKSDSSSDEEDNFCNNDGNITVRKPPLK